jgi:hypothetical protein
MVLIHFLLISGLLPKINVFKHEFFISLTEKQHLYWIILKPLLNSKEYKSSDFFNRFGAYCFNRNNTNERLSNPYHKHAKLENHLQNIVNIMFYTIL